MRNSEVYRHIAPRLENLNRFIAENNHQTFDTSEIYNNLSQENQYFLSNIDDSLKLYLGCLSNVFRWKEHVFDKITSNIDENDYDHVLEMLKINTKIKSLGIPSINHSEVELMILLHDGGEIITDDMSSNHPDSDDNFIRTIKRLEPKFFNRFILSNLDNNQKKYLSSLYDRYEHRQNNPDDTSAHLVKLIDILQGDEFGLKNVYNKEKLFEFYKDKQLPVSPDQIVRRLIEKEIDQTKIVLNSINNPENKQRLYEYLDVNHSSEPKYTESGYSDIYCEFKSSFIFLNPSLGPSSSK